MQSAEPSSKLPLQNYNKIERKDPAIETLPFINYFGKIKYCTSLIDCALLCDNLLSKVRESAEVFAVGFDLEWPFSFQTGSGKTAVIQLSPSLEECFILQVSRIKNLPKSLTELIAHPNIRLTGVNIKNDVRKLARDFHGIDVDTVINNCIDVGTQANKVLCTQRRWSMANLVNECFQMQIKKDKKVRMSKWHIVPLSKEQQQYAATDAYVSLKLYFHLKELEMAQTNKVSKINTGN